MAVDIFATFIAPTSASSIVIGETTTDVRSKGIRVLSLSFGLQNQLNIGSASTGAGAGKATFQPIVITKAIDTTTLALAMALATGAHYDTVTFDFFIAGATPATKGGSIYTVACKMVAVSNIDQAISAGDDSLTEQITMQCGAIQIRTKPQNKDGTLGKEVMMQWSRVRNTPTFDV